MAEIFKEAQAFNNHPDRWNHDWSHKTYGSYKMGVIYPVMTELLQPTQTIKVDMAALLQFMPTPTPLQSNVRVIFHGFFQRMKNIHEDWTNTIEQLEEHELPYILPSVKEFVPGSLHDFLGVPCVSVNHGLVDYIDQYAFGDSNISDTPHSQNYFVALTPLGAFNYYYSFGSNVGYSFAANGGFFSLQSYGVKRVPVSSTSDDLTFSFSNLPFEGFDSALELEESTPVPYAVRISLSDKFGFSRNYSSPFRVVAAKSFSETYPVAPFKVVFDSALVSSAIDALRSEYSSGYDVIHFDILFRWTPLQVAKWVDAEVESVTLSAPYVSAESFGREDVDVLKGGVVEKFFVSNSYPLADLPMDCPYATKEFPDKPIRLRAFRYRTYESAYNAFYRNLHGNQPFIVDGVTQYNKYNTTRASGVDTTDYHFFNRNWELDAYTSALPSPQQGNPPVIGITATGRLTVQDDDGTRSTAQLYDLPEGQQGLSISQINAANDTHRSIIMSLASSGFTINDLRDGNALTKFLETNIRKGFRYVDFIMGHFGKAPSHAEMDMPEFVGGFTVKLDVGKVTNTNAAANAENPNDVLGQFAGSAQAFGGSKHSMQYYADDYGYFMITMCIVPDAAYSQILPKDFLYSQPLDFPFPEFTHLGYQPITYEEFCPIEAYKDQIADVEAGVDNPRLITDVFGYQRPQYERVWKPDTLHGQFLTTMNNYVISRFFSGRPELGNDFFTIKPEETQNVFSVTKADNDICFGQLSFAITVKQPVPRISIPSIGR